MDVLKMALSILLLSCSFYLVASLDSYRFALQCPKTVCSASKCTRPTPPIFTIHGLWPEDREQHHPLKQNILDKFPNLELLKLLNGVYAKLQQRWPDFVFGNDYSFWLNQWNKHGSYSEKTPTAYLSYVIAMDGKLKVDRLVQELAMQENPIKIGESYDLSVLEGALKTTLGAGKVSVLITCTPKSELREVSIYLNSSTGFQSLDPILFLEPPNSEKSYCKQKILIPSP